MQIQPDVQRGKLEQARDGAVDARRGMPEVSGDFEGIGCGFIPQREDRAAVAAQLHRLSLVAAGCAEHHARFRGARRARGLGRQFAADARLLGRIVIAEMRLLQREPLDPQARVFVLLSNIQEPVLAAVGGSFQVNHGAIKRHLGKDIVAP